LAKNLTFPAVLTVAVIVTTVPFAAVTAPPVSEIVIVASPPPAVTVRVKVSVSEPAKLFAVNGKHYQQKSGPGCRIKQLIESTF
jgi:hypothetical protein